MKKRGFTLLELTVIVAILVILAAILMPVFSRSRCGPSCSDKLRRMGVALVQYQDDYDALPRVATTGGVYGWADALQLYRKNSLFYQCPLQKVDGQYDPRKSGYTDYWFNANISGVAAKEITRPARIITFGDGNFQSDLTDARYSLFALPQTWLDNQESPLYRHGGGAIYAFADGHAKRLEPGLANSLFAPR